MTTYTENGKTYEVVEEPPIKVMTTHQLAELIGVTDGSLRNMRNRGIGPDYIKLGNRRTPVLYRVEDVQEWLLDALHKQNIRRGKAVK